MQFEQAIDQLEARKGGYFYLRVKAATVETFSRKRATRLLVNLDERVEYGCGLNHMGDGDYFIIVAGRYLKQLQKEKGDIVQYTLREDPNPLGVAIPEVLSALLEQDEAAKTVFDRLTDGKKRSLIYSIQKVKDIDKQVDKILAFLEKEDRK
ncbi:MAG: YdeI/OmpD-associated family protein [Bacteroidota bacterium]